MDRDHTPVSDFGCHHRTIERQRDALGTRHAALVGLFLLILALAQTHGHLTAKQEAEHLKALRHLHVIRMPEHHGALSPILHVVPLQLLAYHTACARGTDVDKPRNLAKSVTVE